MNKKEQQKLITVFKILESEAQERAHYTEDASQEWKDWYRGQTVGICIAKDWLSGYFPFLEEEE